MTHQMVTEILAAQADRLVAGEAHADDYLVLFPELRSELAPLLQLAYEIASALQPVRPRATYRSELQQALVRAGRDPSMPGPTGLLNLPDLRRDWVLGAAALGSAVSVMGVIAYVWRARTANTRTASTPH
jgi:hypothetical protein